MSVKDIFGKGDKGKAKRAPKADVDIYVEPPPAAPARAEDFTPAQIEKMIRLFDMRQQQYGPQQRSTFYENSEAGKDLRRLVVDTPKNKKRELTIFNEKQTALMPWLRMLEHSFMPMYVYEVVDGRRIKKATGRKPGSCLTVLMDEQESCNRSKNGFLLTQVLGMAKQQIEDESYSKGMSSYGQY